VIAGTSTTVRPSSELAAVADDKALRRERAVILFAASLVATMIDLMCTLAGVTDMRTLLTSTPATSANLDAIALKVALV
jgi:hypothetical protein